MDRGSSAVLFESYERALAAFGTERTKIGMSIGNAMQWNPMAALRCAVQGDQMRGKCFESECHQDLVRRNPNYMLKEHSILVPAEAQCIPLLGVRDLTAASATGGGYLVGTKNVSFIELARNRSVTTALGARRIPGLRDNVTVPRQTGASSTTWLTTESTSIGESQMTLGQVALSPKSVSAYSELSRQLVMQASPAVGGVVFADFARSLGLATDLAVISGTGASGQPLGLLNTPGVGAVTGASIALAGVMEFQSDVIGGKDVDLTSLGYVAPVNVAMLLKGRVAFAGTASPLWEGNLADGQVGGCRAICSAQVPDSTLVFGIWSDVVIGEWGMLELEINPYANFQKAIYGARAIMSVDIAFASPASFSVATSVS